MNGGASVDVGDTETVAASKRRYVHHVDYGNLDPLGDDPLWVQLYGLLRAAIESGEYAPGNPLPSARQIQEISGLSRITIGKAYSRLRDEKLIRMPPGRGPFVAPR